MKAAPPPSVLVLPITDSCDGRCQMCGIWRVAPRNPVTVDFLRQVFSDVYFSSHLSHINVTGGEPLQHPDISGIAQVLNEKCPMLEEVSINTSGLNTGELIGIEILREVLSKSIFLNITLSIDGVGELHDRIRGVRSAWKNALNSLAWIKDFSSSQSKVKPLINYTISRDNCNRRAVLDIVNFSRNCGVDLSLTYGAVNDLYLRNNDSRTDRFSLSLEQQSDLSGTIEELLQDDGFADTQKHFFKMLIVMLRGGGRCSGCIYQTYGVFLDLDGSVYPCGTAKQLSYGKLPEQSFEEIYAGEPGHRIRSQLLQSVCPNCPSNSYYGLAPGVWLDVLKNRRSSEKTR